VWNIPPDGFIPPLEPGDRLSRMDSSVAMKRCRERKGVRKS
jgi:hypothetical protein